MCRLLLSGLPGSGPGRSCTASAYPVPPARGAHPGGGDGPSFWLHPLKDDRAGQWSVRVSGNWRVVFRFEDGEAVNVDLIVYQRPDGSTGHERYCERSRRPEAEPAAPGRADPRKHGRGGLERR
ncbi:MAG: type II toxin-antitoxin system RelE/ParE family toxin [Rhodospirillales bacterium]|nr:type II toxin-antitoxin system RelE/ParE family toxin [Rhodospirillales bacterium]